MPWLLSYFQIVASDPENLSWISTYFLPIYLWSGRKVVETLRCVHLWENKYVIFCHTASVSVIMHKLLIGSIRWEYLFFQWNMRKQSLKNLEFIRNAFWGRLIIVRRLIHYISCLLLNFRHVNKIFARCCFFQIICFHWVNTQDCFPTSFCLCNQSCYQWLKFLP